MNGKARLVCVVALTFSVAPTSPVLGQTPSEGDYLGTWEYDGDRVHFTFVLRPDGTGYLADEVSMFPFTYSLDARVDPALLDLTYDVDMAFGRFSETLVGLERSVEGDLLHWVSHPLDSARPAWPESKSRTPSGVTWITFHRVESGRQARTQVGGAF